MWLDESKMPQGSRVGGVRLLDYYNAFWTSFYSGYGKCRCASKCPNLWSEETRANIRVIRRRSVFGRAGPPL